MANITLSVPADLHKQMKHFSDIRWSEVARKAIMEKVETLRMAENLASKSRLTQADVDEFSRKMKSLASKRFME